MKKIIVTLALVSAAFTATAQTSAPFKVSSQKALAHISFDSDLSKEEIASYIKRAKKLNVYNEVLFALLLDRKIDSKTYKKMYKAANGELPDMRLNYGPMPYPTTDKFLPPAIHHDEEVTKPEPKYNY